MSRQLILKNVFRSNPHRYQNTVSLPKIAMLNKPLKHPRSLNRQDKLSISLKLQLLNRNGNRISARTKLSTNNLDSLASIRILVNNNQLSCHFTTFFFRN